MLNPILSVDCNIHWIGWLDHLRSQVSNEIPCTYQILSDTIRYPMNTRRLGNMLTEFSSSPCEFLSSHPRLEDYQRSGHRSKPPRAEGETTRGVGQQQPHSSVERKTMDVSPEKSEPGSWNGKLDWEAEKIIDSLPTMSCKSQWGHVGHRPKKTRPRTVFSPKRERHL